MYVSLMYSIDCGKYCCLICRGQKLLGWPSYMMSGGTLNHTHLLTQLLVNCMQVFMVVFICIIYESPALECRLC